MFDRAMVALIITAGACAVAAMAVFAAGFALYFLILPSAGPAGAAGIVALIGALILSLAVVAIMLRSRAKEREREREAAIAQAQIVDQIPFGLGEFARDRPIVTLAVTALGGILASRHPKLARDLLSIVARFGR
jgi:hypothetical protein